MTAPEQPTPLLPCPFCGSRAVFGEITDPEDEGNFGGHFITCTGCVATTDLRFACGDDPEPLLAEAWNRRFAAQRAAEAERQLERMRQRYHAAIEEGMALMPPFIAAAASQARREAIEECAQLCTKEAEAARRSHNSRMWQAATSHAAENLASQIRDRALATPQESA